MSHYNEFKIIYTAWRSRAACSVGLNAPACELFSLLCFPSVHSKSLSRNDRHRELVYHHVKKNIILILETRNELEGCAYYGKIQTTQYALGGQHPSAKEDMMVLLTP